MCQNKKKKHLIHTLTPEHHTLQSTVGAMALAYVHMFLPGFDCFNWHCIALLPIIVHFVMVLRMGLPFFEPTQS